LAGMRAGGKPRMERAREGGGREDGSWMTFAGPKKRRRQRAKFPTRVDSAWDKAVALAENGGSDGVSGSVGGMASEEFLVRVCACT
jgi:hypothetical protein